MMTMMKSMKMKMIVALRRIDDDDAAAISYIHNIPMVTLIFLYQFRLDVFCFQKYLVSVNVNSGTLKSPTESFNAFE